jgi:hypothetical protein
MSIKNYKEFKKVFENKKDLSSITANVEDLLFMLKQKDPKSPFVNLNWRNGDRYFVDGFEPIYADKLVSLGSNIEFGKHTKNEITDLKLISQKIGEILDYTFDDSSYETTNYNFKTTADLINDLEKIEDKENTYFFIKEDRFLEKLFSLKGIGNYNYSSYPLMKDGKIIEINSDECYTFTHDAKEEYGEWKIVE